MKNRHFLPIIASCGALALLSACDKTPEKDYDSEGACMDQGLHPGTTEFEKCVGEEKASHALDQQREEFQQQQEERDYWRTQRSMY